jgi:hypothetical protein
MEKSFENLFRKSAFASYQKGQIIQVQKGQKKTQNYDFGTFLELLLQKRKN